MRRAPRRTADRPQMATNKATLWMGEIEPYMDDAFVKACYVTVVRAELEQFLWCLAAAPARSGAVPEESYL